MYVKAKKILLDKLRSRFAMMYVYKTKKPMAKHH